MRLVNLFMPAMHHCENATVHLLKELNIKFTQPIYWMNRLPILIILLLMQWQMLLEFLMM